MEIIYIENTDPFENFVGGIPTYVRNAAKFIQNKGNKVCFVGSILDPINDKNRGFFDEVKSLSCSKISHTKFLLKLFVNKNRISVPREAIIHSQRLLLCLPFIFSVRKYKLICTSHGMEKKNVQGRRGIIPGFIYSMIERIVVPRLKVLTVVDPRAEEYYKKRYPSMIDKIVRIPIGIEVERFYPMKIEDADNIYDLDLSSKNLLFVGRIEYPKNLKLLLDAYNLVKRTMPDIHLIIAGEGRDKEFFENYCIQQNINSVRFIGAVPPNKLVHLLNLCDLLLLSSHFEGSPTVVKEAISCNLPVVSTDVGDVAEVIQGLKACYITKFDPSDIAAKVIFSLENHVDVNYQDKVKIYNNDIIFGKLLETYKSIM